MSGSKTWPKYSAKDAFEDGECAFDAGRPCEIPSNEIYDTDLLKESFLEGWKSQQKKKSK